MVNVVNVASRDRTVLQDIAGEPTVMLGAGRALLLQLAHPAVAQGVVDHSDFDRRPFDRLFGTTDFLVLVAFGTPHEAERIGVAIRKAHHRIVGPGYDGNDPELQVWVNATLIDAALEIHRRMFGDRGLAERYYEQAKLVAEVLGCPADAQPADLDAFRAYMDHMISTLDVSEAGREAARNVLWPRKLWYLAPAMALFRFVTAGMTPVRLREQFGLDWSERRQRRLDLLFGLASGVTRLTPRPIRRLHLPIVLRLARRRVNRKAQKYVT